MAIIIMAVIWKNWASSPLKGFLFCRFIFFFCFLKLYANSCFHVSEMVTSLLIDSPTTPSAKLAGTPLAGYFTCCITWAGQVAFKGQWMPTIFLSGIYMKDNITPLGEKLLKGTWEFDSLNNSQRAGNVIN